MKTIDKLSSEAKRNLEQQFKAIKSKAIEVVPEEELREKIAKSILENRPMKVKFGIDPTGNDLHVGHAVPLRKLKQFQQLGHEIEFIIGSFTAKIGDPTGKSETRKVLSDEEIESNFKTYLDQASKIIDIDKINIHYNGDWLSKLNFEDLLKIMSCFSLSVMISREDFSKRLKSNMPISLVELSYPMMQAYDSVYLESDIEIGGNDQKFNLLRGRDLQRFFGQEPQACLMLPILEGTTGIEKMSKSLNNYISINEEKNNMYGKIMSIKDELIKVYLELVTELSDERIEEIISLSPYEAKKALASSVVELYYDNEAAKQAEEHFKKVFSKRELPENIPKVKIEADYITLVAKVANVSKSQARRLIESNAVKKDQVTINLNDKPEVGILKVGKKLFVEMI